MSTQVNQKQVTGSGFGNIALELDNLRAQAQKIEINHAKMSTDIYKKIGHFDGQVENETDLFDLNVPDDSQVFVKAKNQYYRKTVIGWVSILGGASDSDNSGNGVDYEQVTKLNVVAPETFGISVPYTADLSRPPLEVLRLDAMEGSTTTSVDFLPTDASTFVYDDRMVELNAGLTLRQSHLEPMTLSEPSVYRTRIKKSDYKQINSLEVK